MLNELNTFKASAAQRTEKVLTGKILSLRGKLYEVLGGRERAAVADEITLRVYKLVETGTTVHFGVHPTNPEETVVLRCRKVRGVRGAEDFEAALSSANWSGALLTALDRMGELGMTEIAYDDDTEPDDDGFLQGDAPNGVRAISKQMQRLSEENRIKYGKNRFYRS